MLADARLMAFIPVTHVGVARAFYVETLGLPLIDESPFSLVVDAHGIEVRITPVPDLAPQPFTIVGWEVPDIDGMIESLTGQGVRFTRYEGMGQQPNGVWVTPNGDRVAWFTDPDGNTLSLTTFAAR